MANDPNETLRKSLFSDKWMAPLLGIGLLAVLYNVAVFFGINTRPNAWLFYLNVHYWQSYIPVSLVLWATVIWIALEKTDIVEDYLAFIRILATVSILAGIIFTLRDSLNIINSGPRTYSLWFSAAIVITVSCAVRSLYLLYIYWNEGAEYIDLEEAQWFWGLSGFLLTVLVAFGVMHAIPVKTQIPIGVDSFVTESLFQNCLNELYNMIQTGHGPFMVQVFGLLVFISSFVFLYIAGKWAFICLSRFRGE